MDHLEVPPIVDNDQGPKGEDIHENEDAMEDNDDYPTFDMKEFLGQFVLNIEQFVKCFMLGHTYETILIVMDSFYELCMSCFCHLYFFK